MAFKLIRNPTFTHKVYVMVPIDGSFREETLKVTFRVRSQTDLFEHDLRTPEGTEAYCRAVVEKFADVQDEDGNPMDLSEADNDALFALPYVQIALISYYTTALSKARAKN